MSYQRDHEAAARLAADVAAMFASPEPVEPIGEPEPEPEPSNGVIVPSAGAHPGYETANAAAAQYKATEDPYAHLARLLGENNTTY